jgi:hypothetical protein
MTEGNGGENQNVYNLYTSPVVAIIIIFIVMIIIVVVVKSGLLPDALRLLCHL